MADEPPPFEEDQENDPEEELFDDPAATEDPFGDVKELTEEKKEVVEPDPQPYEIPVPVAATKEKVEEEEEEAAPLLPPAHEPAEKEEEEEDKLSVESDEVKVKPPELVPSSGAEVRNRTDHVLIIRECHKRGTTASLLPAWREKASHCYQKLSGAI